MNDAFRHLHMPVELACELLAVLKAEHALKAMKYASESEGRATASWDKFANDIDREFGEVTDDEFADAVNYLLTYPPRRQFRKNGVLTFEDQEIDQSQARAQQVLLMVRTVRNNLRDRHPIELNAHRLSNETVLLFAWAEQRRVLGFN